MRWLTQRKPTPPPPTPPLHPSSGTYPLLLRQPQHLLLQPLAFLVLVLVVLGGHVQPQLQVLHLPLQLGHHSRVCGFLLRLGLLRRESQPTTAAAAAAGDQTHGAAKGPKVTAMLSRDLVKSFLPPAWPPPPSSAPPGAPGERTGPGCRPWPCGGRPSPASCGTARTWCGRGRWTRP